MPVTVLVVAVVELDQSVVGRGSDDWNDRAAKEGEQGGQGLELSRKEAGISRAVASGKGSGWSPRSFKMLGHG